MLGMRQKSGGGRKSGGGPILISAGNRQGNKDGNLLESITGDAYYNNPNVGIRNFLSVVYVITDFNFNNIRKGGANQTRISLRIRVHFG